MTNIEKQLRAFYTFRRGAGRTTNVERDEILANAKKALQDEVDNPTPREAPERGSVRRAAGQPRQLDAEFDPRDTELADGRTAQVIDVLTRA